MKLKEVILILIGVVGVMPGLILGVTEVVYWINNPHFTQMDIFQKFLWWNIGTITISISCYFIIKYFENFLKLFNRN